jgi:hypothetical protein
MNETIKEEVAVKFFVAFIFWLLVFEVFNIA